MRLIFSAITIALLTGCAATKSVHTPPSQTKVTVSKTVQSEFEPVWNGLVKELSSSFFVVNNIDKNSRFINISFGSNQASKYVNCGKITITPEGAPNAKTQTWDPTRQTVIKEVARVGPYQIPVLVDVSAAPKLEGRINMYIAPVDGGGTEAKVAVRYILNVNKRVMQPQPQMAWYGEAISESFSTNGASDELGCVATGELERELLNLVK